MMLVLWLRDGFRLIRRRNWTSAIAILAYLASTIGMGWTLPGVHWLDSPVAMGNPTPAVTWPPVRLTSPRGSEELVVWRERESERTTAAAAAAATATAAEALTRSPLCAHRNPFRFRRAPMPGPTQALSPNGENNNDIIQDNGTNIIPYRKNTVRGERAYR